MLERRGRLAAGPADASSSPASRPSSLLVVGTPIAWWLARSRARWKEAVATVVALPLVLPPTVLGFYLLVALGPNGPGGWIASLFGGRSLAFTFEGLVIGSVIYSMPFVVQPIRNAFEAFGERPLEVAATLRASPSGRLLDGRRAARPPGLSDRRGPGLRPYGRRVRRRADDRRQHSRRDQGPLGRHLRLRRDPALGARRSILAGGMLVFSFAVILAMTLLEKRVGRLQA